jgi:hypothetical protein
LLSNAKNVSHLILTVAGSRSSPNTMACPVAIHSCQPNQLPNASTPPHGRWALSALLALPIVEFLRLPHITSYPLRRTSRHYSSYCSLLGTQYSNCSIHSHSGGPLGTVAYHSLLGFLHALFPGTSRSIVGSCYLVVSASSHMASGRFRLPRTINSFGSSFHVA